MAASLGGVRNVDAQGRHRSEALPIITWVVVSGKARARGVAAEQHALINRTQAANANGRIGKIRPSSA
jgi:hypothetical protein